MQNNGNRAGFITVGKIGCSYDNHEGEEIGRGGESLCLGGRVAHVSYDTRQENWHAAECYITAKEHCLENVSPTILFAILGVTYSCEVTLRIHKCL
jgi:hypothetical protein